MGSDRFTKGWSPEKGHLVRGRSGVAGEVTDLRGDVEEAFKKLAQELASTNLFVDISPASPTGAVGAPVVVTVQLRDAPAGDPVALAAYMQLAVFDDVHASVPSVTAVIANATFGTIVSGSGTSATKILTYATGKAVVEVTNAAATTVYVAAAPDFKSPSMTFSDDAQIAYA